MRAAEFTFGVEIETLAPRSLETEGLRVGGYHYGAQVPYLPTGWTAQGDSSIHGNGSSELACEIVSPVLCGEEGLREVARVVETLREKGHRVNASCGVHVHVGWDPTRPSDQLARLVRMTSYLEKALYAITGTTKRERGHWCGSIRRHGDTQHATQQAESNRYHVLNLRNLAHGRKHTVEFRCFSGSLDATKILGWIMVCIGMVHKAVEVHITNGWTPRGDEAPTKAVSNLLYYLGWSKSGQKNLRGRQFGWMENPVGFAAIRKTFLRLARKYQAERESQGTVFGGFRSAAG